MHLRGRRVLFVVGLGAKIVNRHFGTVTTVAGVPADTGNTTVFRRERFPIVVATARFRPSNGGHAQLRTLALCRSNGRQTIGTFFRCEHMFVIPLRQIFAGLVGVDTFEISF